jgi:hypothetical protein
MSVINTFEQLKNNPSNLSTVNLNNLNGDGSKFFNNYFDNTISISTAKDDAVVSYFEKVTANKDSALALSSAVIYTARVQNMDVMAVLDEFKKLNQTQLTPYISYFLNLSRIGTSLIGVQNNPARNKYVTRSIIA